MQNNIDDDYGQGARLANRGRAAMDGEHRYVAALMADIAGSTEITERIGAEQWFHLVQEVIQLAWSTLEQFHGYPLNFTGDGVFALFGAPVAVEKASLNACRAALALQARLEEQAPRYMRDFGVSPKIRIGIAGGEVLIVGMNLGSEVKPTATGSAVNLASRLQNLAPTDGIACSAQIVMDVGDDAIFESLGDFSIKGFDGMQAAHRLVGLAAGAAAGGAANVVRKSVFVGRDEPLANVAGWLAAPSSYPICLICGEAGIGKSRFVEELAARIADRRKLLVGSCQVETRARSLAPIVEIFRQWVGWAPGQPLAVLQAALAERTGQPEKEVTALVEVVADLGMTSERATPDAALILRRSVVSALQRLAAQDDYLVLIEDAHWIDPMSRDVLTDMAADVARNRKVLATSRLNRLLGADDERATLSLTLKPISRDDIVQIARAGRDQHAVADAVVDLVVAKSEGNPFFATEILKHVRLSGATDLEKLRVGTIQNLLFASFEGLPKDVRDLLRVAAVLGRTFKYSVVAQASGVAEDEVRRALDSAKNLIEADPGDARANGRFVHVLFRDTIYASLPATRRAQLHLDVAQAMEALVASGDAPEAAVNDAATFAFHYEAAGRPLQAVSYLDIAAQRALDFFALETSDTLLRTAFKIIDQQTENITFDTYGRMLEKWARCLDLYGQHNVVIGILSERLPHLRKGGASPSLAACLAFLAKTKSNVAQYDDGLALANEAIEMAQKVGDPTALAIAQIVKMKALSDSGTGTLEEARALFDATRDVLDFRRDPQMAQLRNIYMISAARGGGAFKEGQRINEDLHALAVRLKSDFLVGAVAWQNSLRCFNFDDLDGAAEAAATCVRYTLPGTIFNLCGRLAAVRVDVLRNKHVSAETFKDMLAEAEWFGEATLVTSVDVTEAASHILNGRIREWHRIIKRIRARPMNGGSVEMRRFLAMFEAEVLMSIAGIVKSDRPRPKIGIGDKIYAVVLRLTALKRAERLLLGATAQYAEGSGGGHLGRMLGDLAIIAKTRKDKARAERLFAECIELCDREEYFVRSAWLRRQMEGYLS